MWQNLNVWSRYVVFRNKATSDNVLLWTLSASATLSDLFPCLHSPYTLSASLCAPQIHHYQDLPLSSLDLSVLTPHIIPSSPIYPTINPRSLAHCPPIRPCSHRHHMHAPSQQKGAKKDNRLQKEEKMRIKQSRQKWHDFLKVKLLVWRKFALHFLCPTRRLAHVFSMAPTPPAPAPVARWHKVTYLDA